VLYQLFTLVLDTAQPEDYLKKETTGSKKMIVSGLWWLKSSTTSMSKQLTSPMFS